jgi:hypothetical protein
VVLKTEDGDLTKEFTFLPETYELLITDSSSLGSSGKPLLRFIEQREGLWI